MLGVIVTYNPELKSLISDLIEPLKKHGIKILVIDNSSKEIVDLSRIVDYFVRFEKNYGLGKAYNYAMKMALSLHEDWLLLLDQDSKVIDITEMLTILKHIPKDTCCISINKSHSSIIKMLNSQFFLGTGTVNSGLIVRVDSKLHWNEDLFVDQTDVEFIVRNVIKLKLGNLLIYHKDLIQHRIGEGEREIRRFLSKIIFKIIYILLRKKMKKGRYTIPLYKNYIRYYLILRNTVYIMARYRVIRELIYSLFFSFIGLYEEKKYYMIIRALIIGLTGKLKEDNRKIFAI